MLKPAPHITREYEQALIKRDMLKTLAVNAFLLAVLFTLFFINRTNGSVENVVQRAIHALGR